MVGGKTHSDEEIFQALRAWIPEAEKKDAELRKLIAGAHKLNPTPAIRSVSGSYDRDRQVARFKVANAPRGSPGEIPASEHSAIEFLSALFKPEEIICITSTATERDGKYQPANAGSFLTLEKWREKFAEHNKIESTGR
jgi:hypothetical protein